MVMTLLREANTDSFLPPLRAQTSFASLEEAELSLFDSLDREEKSKLDQVIAILEIKRGQLYKERIDPDTGDPFAYFEDYLASIEPELERRGVGKMSSIKKWIASYRVICEQLGFSQDYFLSLGAHGKEVMPAANLEKLDSVLSDEEKPMPGGGRKLGAIEFKEFVEEIHQRVEMQSPGFPELAWKVSDTRDRVHEIVGSPESVSWEWKVTPAGAFVNIQEASVFIGSDGVGKWYHFYTKEAVPLSDFKLFAKGKIIGLDEVPGG